MASRSASMTEPWKSVGWDDIVVLLFWQDCGPHAPIRRSALLHREFYLAAGITRQDFEARARYFQ
jgi:hypothetical protein